MSHQGATLSNGENRTLMTSRVRALAIIGLTLAMIVAMALAPRIPQNESYHDFADQRAVLGISNFLNVVSNLPFLFVGIAGLLFLTRKQSTSSRDSFFHRFERWPYAVFFLGVTLACFGSAYYHLSPNSDRLMWDRLPMSIAFMSLLAAVIAERINVRVGLASLAPLVAVGVASVIYWHLGELSGVGDLRPHVLVQFYSLVAIILTRSCFRHGILEAASYWLHRCVTHSPRLSKFWTRRFLLWAES
jgi:ceramidase